MYTVPFAVSWYNANKPSLSLDAFTVSLIVFLAFLVKACFFVQSSKLLSSQKAFFIFTVILFSWLVWVPSSILRLPLVWYPIFLILIYAISINQAAVNSILPVKNSSHIHNKFTCFHHQIFKTILFN